MRLAVTFLATALVLLSISACGKPAGGPPGQMPPPPVGVATPISRELPIERVLTGRIEAVETVELKPQVSGKILSLEVKDGAKVTAGQILMRIDPATFQAALARYEAEVMRAKARLAQAELLRRRNSELADGNLVSRQASDDANAAADAAKADVAAAEAGLLNARLDLDHCELKAPIAGIIGRINNTPGNLVQGGGPVPATLITTIQRSDTVRAVADLDENTWALLAPRVAAGEPVRIRVGLAGETTLPHATTLSFTANQVDSATGTMRLYAELANPAGILTPGAFARIAVEIAPPRPVLLVHERAILAQLATRYVLTVDAQGGTAFRPVQLGERVGELRMVTGGVGPDDRIAVNNLAKIFFPGMPVTPVPASMETTVNLAAANSPAAPGPEAKP